MKRGLSILSLTLSLVVCACAANAAEQAHPDSGSWQALFKKDLSNAQFPKGVWSVDEQGVLTATEDQVIWAARDYENFVIDLEFKTAPGCNSGLIVYCSDTKNWIPNSVEIQIADDYAKQWATSPRTWQCAAFFGHQAATKSNVKKPGEWNRFTVTCKGQNITVALNGEAVNNIDLSKFTDAKKNPDGSEVPAWLSKAPATLATKGRVGLQGKHAGAPIYFRNVRVREL